MRGTLRWGWQDRWTYPGTHGRPYASPGLVTDPATALAAPARQLLDRMCHVIQTLHYSRRERGFDELLKAPEVGAIMAENYVVVKVAVQEPEAKKALERTRVQRA